MKKVNLLRLPETEKRSPSGKFCSFARDVSLALGGKPNVGPWGGGHPFDLQLRRIPPGAAICPFHSHLAQWELFVVRSGKGTVRAGSRRHTVRAGDCFVHPPGEAHQLINTGKSDLEVLIVADNPPIDAFHYPDSDKWGLRTPPVFFRMTPVDYFDGEDEAGHKSGREKPAAPVPQPAVKTPFSKRRINIGDIAWEKWRSPKGRFAQRGKDLSCAIGDVRNGWPQCGHPFNLELVRVPAGKEACPYHWHAGQWEMFMILEGTATIRAGRARKKVGPGDVFIHPPGRPHQIANAGRTDLEFFIIADNPPVDVFHYPDSKKWGFRPPRKIFRMTEVRYNDGEE